MKHVLSALLFAGSLGVSLISTASQLTNVHLRSCDGAYCYAIDAVESKASHDQTIYVFSGPKIEIRDHKRQIHIAGASAVLNQGTKVLTIYKMTAPRHLDKALIYLRSGYDILALR